MKALAVLAAIALALAVQTTLGRYVALGAFAPDLVLVVVVYVALRSGPVTGLLSGTLGGLAQDALSSGIIGIGGLAKTVVGFLAGAIGRQFIVTAPVPRFVVFAAATLLHAVVFVGLYSALDLRPFGNPYGAVLGQTVGNAAVGIVAFQLAEMLPGAAERRRASRVRRPHRLR